ncbi:TrlF family AAA-like ATPase [Macellibacteroides fermentans]|uniref:TrlF family AAA-like ATPase n=1 Tax=Macellibacteroides fermentans TaxID=879969 RepID=UPI00406CFF76
MDTCTLFQNGTTWLRADFHLHTKADKEFTYAGDVNDFVNQYVNKLVEQNIRVGVITNHNKFDAGEYKAIAKKARKEGIYVLPGVELSVNDGANGVHTLVVFDPNQWLADGNDYINQFITTNFIGKHNYENENGRSNHSLKETLLQLDKLNKNFFVIMAHVEQNSGLLNEFDGGRIIDLGNDPLFRKSVIGFQKMRTNDLKNNLDTWLENKVPCFVEGSDPKSIDDIGKGEACFLKIGDFNFEAVKFALIDSIDRCSKENNHKPANSHIKSIAFQGGLLDGKQISFSPELNNLIGIRGSGKSSILEIVRYALNIPFGSQAVDKDYKDDLIKHVLKSGGKAVVEIVDRHGAIYKVERIYGQKEDIYKDDILQQGITLDAILQQPIYFGQKDLSSKNADFENDLVNKLIGSRLNNVQTRIEKQKTEIQRIINEFKSFGNLSLLKKETETAKANAEYRLNLFKEKGVAEKLQLQTSFESDINRLQNFKTGVDSYLNDLQGIIQNHEYSLNKELESKTNPEIFEEAISLVDKLKATLGQIKTIYSDAQKTGAEFAVVIDKLKAKKEELKEEFARIKREIDIPELNPDDFIKINRELETSKLKLIEIEKSEGKRVELERLLNEAVNALDNLWYDKFNLLKAEVNKINEVGGKLFIEVNYKGRKDKFLAKLQEVFRGSRISEVTYTAIRDDYADFIDMRKDGFRKLSDRLTENQLIEVKNRFEANLYDLLTYKVSNQIIINFDGTPLKKHSLGQRASALILFLLSQKENDILIIDQPEDDLDNQTIYEDVIREIKRLKGQMQFIFATHNANIPVLGDSEMLVACQYIPDNEIKIECGSIDSQSIQEKIIRIMEGGQEAFDIRKNIYKIWEGGKL